MREKSRPRASWLMDFCSFQLKLQYLISLKKLAHEIGVANFVCGEQRSSAV